jgi:hypothetical protein
LRPRTRADHIIQIKTIERDLGDFPLKALSARETRGVFLDWRDKLALKSRRQADYAWQVLALILSWAKDRGRIAINPCERGGRLYSDTRAEMIWSPEDEATFLRHASKHLHLPLLLALWTGQETRRFVEAHMVVLRRQDDKAAAIEDRQQLQHGMAKDMQAVTRLALAGATEAEIATITGHSLRDVRSILDVHYLHRDPALAVKSGAGTRLAIASL